MIPLRAQHIIAVVIVKWCYEDNCFLSQGHTDLSQSPSLSQGPFPGLKIGSNLGLPAYTSLFFDQASTWRFASAPALEEIFAHPSKLEQKELCRFFISIHLWVSADLNFSMTWLMMFDQRQVIQFFYWHEIAFLQWNHCLLLWLIRDSEVKSPQARGNGW